MITKAEIIVAHEMRQKFENIYDFVAKNSNMATQANLFENWEIQFLKEDEDFPELTDEITVTEDFDLDMLFENLIKERIADLDLKFRVIEDNIVIDFPFYYDWEGLSDEVWDLFESKIEKREHFNERTFPHLNIPGADNDVMDQIFFNALTQNAYTGFSRFIIEIDCKDLDEAIKETAKQYVEYKESKFTERQIEVLFKKTIGITLSSTERDILQQARVKLEKAQEVVKEVEEYKLNKALSRESQRFFTYAELCRMSEGDLKALTFFTKIDTEEGKKEVKVSFHYADTDRIDINASTIFDNYDDIDHNSVAADILEIMKKKYPLLEEIIITAYDTWVEEENGKTFYQWYIQLDSSEVLNAAFDEFVSTIAKEDRGDPMAAVENFFETEKAMYGRTYDLSEEELDELKIYARANYHLIGFI